MVEFVGDGSKIGLIGRIWRIGVAGEGRFGRGQTVRTGSDDSDKSDDSDGFGRGQTAVAFHGRLIIARHPGLSIKSFILNSTALK